MNAASYPATSNYMPPAAHCCNKGKHLEVFILDMEKIMKDEKPSKAPRRTRPKGELEKELGDQIMLLKLACNSYDQGTEDAAKYISVSLRLLLNHHGRQQSLLEQLGHRNGRFYSSCAPLNPRNLLAEHGLVALRASGDGGSYIPRIAAGFSPNGPVSVPFETWWNTPVLKDSKGRTFNRRELVEKVANTDGGAHVDAQLDEAYMELSRDNSLGWTFQNGDIVSPLAGRPELACMRQIAHELLITLEKRFPHLFENTKDQAS